MLWGPQAEGRWVHSEHKHWVCKPPQGSYLRGTKEKALGRQGCLIPRAVGESGRDLTLVCDPEAAVKVVCSHEGPEAARECRGAAQLSPPRAVLRCRRPWACRSAGGQGAILRPPGMPRLLLGSSSWPPPSAMRRPGRCQGAAGLGNLLEGAACAGRHVADVWGHRLEVGLHLF